jgi:hypothetical protein
MSGLGISETDVKSVLEEDPVLLHHAEVCRDDPDMLRLLLEGVETREGLSSGPIDKAIRATRAISSWAKSGFSMVSEDEYKKRVQACGVCPHSRKGGLLGLGQHTVCSLCGCPIHRKARMASEQCPDSDIGANGRWHINLP